MNVGIRDNFSIAIYRCIFSRLGFGFGVFATANIFALMPVTPALPSSMVFQNDPNDSLLEKAESDIQHLIQARKALLQSLAAYIARQTYQPNPYISAGDYTFMFIALIGQVSNWDFEKKTPADDSKFFGLGQLDAQILDRNHIDDPLDPVGNLHAASTYLLSLIILNRSVNAALFDYLEPLYFQDRSADTLSAIEEITSTFYAEKKEALASSPNATTQANQKKGTLIWQKPSN